mmetsp:Transcript_956/g.1787  ORF Transcript_956/g.1787 Transcript_956/m.1787 type:complete len:131 (+) Transcript_956:68-460(+)
MIFQFFSVCVYHRKEATNIELHEDTRAVSFHRQLRPKSRLASLLPRQFFSELAHHSTYAPTLPFDSTRDGTPMAAASQIVIPNASYSHGWTLMTALDKTAHRALGVKKDSIMIEFDAASKRDSSILLAYS